MRVFLSILALAFSLGVDAGDASAPSAAASPAVVTLTGQQILDKVTAVWESRQEPPYEAFTMPCHEILRTGAEGSCGSSTSMRVYLRTSDGIAHVVTIPKGDEKPVVLLPAGHIYGPAYAPLGFTRKLGATQRVGSLAADPFAPMPTIAAVMAVNYAYDVSVAPDVCQGAPAYRLTLKPHGTNASRPLRELLVDQQSYHICTLTYALQFGGGEANVRYDFAYEDDPAVPVIVKIVARVPGHSLVGVRYSDSSEDLQDIAFPTQIPGLP